MRNELLRVSGSSWDFMLNHAFQKDFFAVALKTLGLFKLTLICRNTILMSYFPQHLTLREVFWIDLANPNIL